MTLHTAFGHLYSLAPCRCSDSVRTSASTPLPLFVCLCKPHLCLFTKITATEHPVCARISTYVLTISLLIILTTQNSADNSIEKMCSVIFKGSRMTCFTFCSEEYSSGEGWRRKGGDTRTGRWGQLCLCFTRKVLPFSQSCSKALNCNPSRFKQIINSWEHQLKYSSYDFIFK